MKKYALIGGSVCAVVLLILASLGTVVGYQSMQPAALSDSPLYSVRTMRATDQQQGIITPRYLGQGETCDLMISPRPDDISSLHQMISRIQAMDERTFNRFVDSVALRLYNNGDLGNVDLKDLKDAIRQLRQVTEDDLEYRDSGSEKRTIFYEYVPSVCWFPGCYILDFFLFILIIFELNLMRLSSMLLSVCVCP
jgi:hypothetical protein